MAKEPYPALIAEDFELTTWMAIGASIYAVMVWVLPFWISVPLPILFLVTRTIKTVLMSKGILSPPSSDTLPGRYTAKIPGPYGRGQGGVVCFILGARINHPMGRAAPGIYEVDKMYRSAWREAAGNRDKYGYLGKSSMLVASEEKGGITFLWLTYWKTLEGLRDFAAGDSHRTVQMQWLAKQYPYLGIMHETYHSPSGSWENIYHDFQPFGLGSTKYAVETDPSTKEGGVETDEKGRPLSTPLISAKGRSMRSMFARMGRYEDINVAKWNPEQGLFDE
ncbi:hypothetical protein AJ80_06604 [Polytolypa hystricis UAMH7299]|uniref:Uncharacterized protein n=1 Tax=Polytolypa hystricis (strain UAMH7299) TaxID=1447883 RepID=A0A2B7XUV3_POLH7|nr:hypothetical protein AJ80_06604 [Polytolypa hystricis UAMH7299]